MFVYKEPNFITLARAFLEELGWPETLTTKQFRGRCGAISISKGIQHLGYMRVMNIKYADGAFRTEGEQPWSLYQKIPTPTRFDAPAVQETREN